MATQHMPYTEKLVSQLKDLGDQEDGRFCHEHADDFENALELGRQGKLRPHLVRVYEAAAEKEIQRMGLE